MQRATDVLAPTTSSYLVAVTNDAQVREQQCNYWAISIGVNRWSNSQRHAYVDEVTYICVCAEEGSCATTKSVDAGI